MMAGSSRAFVISDRRLWLAWTFVAIAVVYFIALVALVVLDYRVQGVTYETLALGGAGLFVLAALVVLPYLFRRKVRAPKEEPSFENEPVTTAPAPVAMRRVSVDDEVRLTDETTQGLRVIEYSTPAKSRNRNAVYTKTHVPVSPSHVVRVETLVAEARDL